MQATQAITLALSFFLVASANAALFPRLNGQAVYDSDLNITWLADANYARTSGYDSDGLMNWSAASAWANGLTLAGYSGWRLPTVSPVNGIALSLSKSYDGTTDVGYNITSPASEMAHLFYVTLGNQGVYASTGMETGCYVAPNSPCLQQTGPFLNLQPDAYWTATFTPVGLWGARFHFDFLRGSQGYVDTSNAFYAWAVRDGDVAPIPEPDAYALLLTGLGLVGVMAQRGKQKSER